MALIHVKCLPEIGRERDEFYDSLWFIYRDQSRVHPIPHVM